MAATQGVTEPEPKHEMILQSQEHSQIFRGQLVILWEEKQFSDVVLKANDNEEFPCHRVVLAAASSYFKAMFNSGMVESCSPTVELENMDADIMSSLIRYMYSGSLKITADNVQRLVESCKPLDFPEIITGCEDFMVQELCPTNCLGFRRFAQLYELKRLKEAAHLIMLKQFSDVVRSIEFGELSVQGIMEYVSDSKLKVKTEDPVFEAVCMWVRVDPASREALFPQIATKVRFPHCSKSYLSSVVVPCPYMSNPNCAAYLQEACTYQMLPEQRDTMSSPRLERREDFPIKTAVVVFGGVTKQWNTDKDNVYKCPKTKTWKTLTGFVSKDLRFYAAVAFEKGIFVTGGRESGIAKKDCFFYDFKDHEWRDMPEMIAGRSHHGSAVQAGNTYVLGGILTAGTGNLLSRPGNSVEVYNKDPGCWTSLVAMPKGLLRPLVVSYGQYIFVTSGKNRGHQSVTTMVYDTVWDRWEHRKDMPKPVLGGSITAFKDKIYVVGGVLPSCLSYDMAVDAWTVLTPPNEAHKYGACNVLQGRIQLYGGEDATNKISGSMEVYNPETDTWFLHEKEYERRSYHHWLHVDM